MSLRDIVQTLGGDLHAGGTQANIPAPGHSARDRSVSLRIGREGQVLVHAFAGTDWREVMDDLRQRGLVDDAHRPVGAGGVGGRRATAAALPDRSRVAVARRIWDAGRAAEGTLTARYAASRRITRALPGAAVVRHLSETPVSVYQPRSAAMPAMLAAIIGPDGRFTAVEATYLDPNGRRTRRLRLPRKTIGVIPASSAVRIDEAAREMLVGEGMFSVLSASERFQLPAWALLSTSNLRTWTAPDGVRSIVIAADRGQDGEASARVLATRLKQARIKVRIAWPPTPHQDWNDAAVLASRA